MEMPIIKISDEEKKIRRKYKESILTIPNFLFV
jgi:hypothetical protein